MEEANHAVGFHLTAGDTFVLQAGGEAIHSGDSTSVLN